MFHSFFQFPSKVEVLILLFTFFQFYSVVSRDSKVDYFANSLLFFFLLLLIIIKTDLLAGIRWSVCMLKSHKSLCVAFSRTGAGLCIYHLLVWSNLNFLHISQWITLPTQSCLASYSRCANLMHSLIIWLIIIIITITIIIIIIYSFRVFHISISWWFFTGVWVTASLLKSPGHVSVFWPSSAMLSFGQSPPVR